MASIPAIEGIFEFVQKSVGEERQELRVHDPREENRLKPTSYFAVRLKTDIIVNGSGQKYNVFWVSYF